MGSTSEQQIAAAITAWFKKHQRDLPWRKTRDPYAIWISEVMLQQTQVKTALPYYLRFLSELPTVSHLAKASEESVLKLWAGLGYYSRAKNLRRGAQYLIEHFGGEFPKTRDELLQVPGIGPYTAGALLSIAFRLREPLVDGNVERVLSRYFAFQEPLPSSKAQQFFWKKAREWVEASSQPHAFNQGLMEIGSLICTRYSPGCPQCPLKTNCSAHALGIAETLPVKKTKAPMVNTHLVKLVFTQQGRLWLHQNPKAQWWSGLWDFPDILVKNPPHWKKEIETRIGPWNRHHWKELQHQKHTVTRHKLHVIPIRIETKENPPFPGKWLTLKSIYNKPLSALAKKILHEEW